MLQNEHLHTRGQEGVYWGMPVAGFTTVAESKLYSKYEFRNSCLFETANNQEGEMEEFQLVLEPPSLCLSESFLISK